MTHTLFERNRRTSILLGNRHKKKPLCRGARASPSLRVCRVGRGTRPTMLRGGPRSSAHPTNTATTKRNTHAEAQERKEWECRARTGPRSTWKVGSLIEHTQFNSTASSQCSYRCLSCSL